MSTYPVGSLDEWLHRHLKEMVCGVRENSGSFSMVPDMEDEAIQVVIVALARAGWMSHRAPHVRCKHCGDGITYIGRADLKPLDRKQWCHVNAKGEYTAFDCRSTYATPETAS